MKYINMWHFARWPCVSTRGTGSSKGEWGEHLRSFRFCVILCLKEKPHNLSSFRLCIVLSQRSLGSILLPPPSVRYTRMRKEQEATFAKRESDQIAVGCVITQAILGALNVQFHICRWSKAPTPRFPSSTGSAPFSPSRSLSFSFSLASSSGLCTMSSKMRATGGPKNLFPLNPMACRGALHVFFSLFFFAQKDATFLQVGVRPSVLCDMDGSCFFLPDCKNWLII